MKQIFFSTVFFLASAAAFAQTNFAFQDAQGMDVTNQALTYWVSDSVTDSRAFTMINNSANPIIVKVRKTNIVLNDPGASTWFCTDINCYSAATVNSLAFTIAANGGTSVLTTDFNPNFALGITRVRYTIIDQTNANDTASIEIDYNMANGGLSGIHSGAAAKPVISQPYPNPAAGLLKLDYNLGSAAAATVNVYDMLGSKVKAMTVISSQGQVTFDVSSFENGIYFCTFEADGKALATRRIVVSH